MDERPVQEWFPRARVSLLLRFEEFGSALSAKPPKTKQTLRKGTAGDKELVYSLDPQLSAQGRNVYVLAPKAGSKIVAISVDELTHALGGILPSTANHSRNGLDKADTLSVELAFVDAPFDPRCVRSCAIEYYLGCITANAAAIEQAQQTTTFLPDTFVGPDGKPRSNRRFIGWVDTWEVDYREGTPVVKLECRDNRSVLIDQEAPAQLHVDPKTPLDKAVADYLSNFPQFSGIGVEWRGANDEPAPKIEDFAAYNVKKAGSKGAGDKSKVMDYLLDIVGMCGCILTMQDTVLVIAKPRTLLKKGSTRGDDPYNTTSRTLNGVALPNRTFVYGHNVKTMKFGRKLNAAAPNNIEVRVYLGSSKKPLVARFPDVTTQAMPGEGADKKWVVMRVQGVTNVETLKMVAQSAYEQQGRQELTVELQTKDFASFGGDNMDPDVLDMLPGDPMDVYVLREQQEYTTVGRIEDAALLQSTLVQFLVDLGHERELAQAYAASFCSGGFQSTFRTRVVKSEFSGGGDEGVSLSIQGGNYIEVRLDKEL